ncbi:MEMO1 family [Lasiosphaeria miniovina]|uniref:MEMO1 family n=1 Tax=Lasiosphaeria miniovina TaxID=1954250 RepID=A0AA40ADJ3_9PEZI|nr:MEMO1 family [Lasiosphaeria miniovina]KAK0713876.1 MEMO1 family [Lasiosphaeria miniovina]
MGTREASHAGSWYEDDPVQLSSQLNEFLGRVPDTLDESSLPVSGARVIIAPHAGYTYSGPCAAWAYKSLDLSAAKRVFVLGPSHTYYLHGCALSTFHKYETPFGDLVVDRATVDELSRTGRFSTMPARREVEEHSLEMHLPYLWKRLEQTFGTGSNEYPPIIPILVGDGSAEEEESFGQILAPYVKDTENVFIVSTDFCHWGSRFRYRPQYKNGLIRNPDASGSPGSPDSGGVLKVQPILEDHVDASDVPAIHEVIKMLDDMAMDAVRTGVHGDFYKTVQDTQNTVCGRHPIGVVMAALEVLARDGLEDGKGRFKFIQYQRSSLVQRVSESSVSYASAYAVA